MRISYFRRSYISKHSLTRFSADTPQRRAVALEVDAVAPVAETLIPRTVVVERRRRPVPNGGIRTGDVKTADGVAILEQHVQFALRRHPPIVMRSEEHTSELQSPM